jgi:tetratricopeptide (TPR) repeat protein
MNRLTSKIKINQTNIKALDHVIEGYKLVRDMKFEDALKSFNKALRVKPNFAEAHSAKGSVLMKLRRYEEALKAFDAAIEQNAADANTFSDKGNALYELKKHDEAIIAFDKAIELDPNSYFPYQKKGKILQDLARYDEAMTMYDQALSCPNIIIPAAEVMMLAKVEILGEQKKWDELEAILEDPKLSDLWEEAKATQNLLLAKCTYGKGEYTRALGYCDEAMRLDNNVMSDALHIKISSLIGLESKDAIITAENEGLQKNMNDGWILMSRAIRKIKEGDLKEADSYFRRAQRFGGTGGAKAAEVEICYFLMRAIQLKERGEYKEAIQSINAGLAYDLEFHRQSLLRHKAVCLNKIEYSAEALECCDEFLAHDTSLTNDPSSMEVLAEKARALHELGQYSAMHDIIGNLKSKLPEFFEESEEKQNGQVLQFPQGKKT